MSDKNLINGLMQLLAQHVQKTETPAPEQPVKRRHLTELEFLRQQVERYQDLSELQAQHYNRCVQSKMQEVIHTIVYLSSEPVRLWCRDGHQPLLDFWSGAISVHIDPVCRTNRLISGDDAQGRQLTVDELNKLEELIHVILQYHLKQDTGGLFESVFWLTDFVAGL